MGPSCIKWGTWGELYSTHTYVFAQSCPIYSHCSGTDYNGECRDSGGWFLACSRVPTAAAQSGLLGSADCAVPQGQALAGLSSLYIPMPSANLLYTCIAPVASMQFSCVLTAVSASAPDRQSLHDDLVVILLTYLLTYLLSASLMIWWSSSDNTVAP